MLLISFLFTVLIIRSSFNVELENGVVDNEALNQIEPEALRAATGFFDVHKYHLTDEKIDWHNYEHMAEEEARVGRGEQGKKEELLPHEETEYNELFMVNGYNGVLSDKISVNRSVKDITHAMRREGFQNL